MLYGSAPTAFRNASDALQHGLQNVGRDRGGMLSEPERGAEHMRKQDECEREYLAMKNAESRKADMQT